MDKKQKPVNTGQLRGPGSESFAETMNSGIVAPITGMDSLHNDIGEKSGFTTTGYLDKKGTPYGESAKFNFMPPGMNISNQENADINNMPMRELVSTSYPGDGWSPAPRDVAE